MAIASGIAIRFKQDCLAGDVHSISAGYVGLYMALFSAAASLDNNTSIYPTSAEVANGNGYTTGGNICTVLSVSVDGSVAYLQFADQSWTSATFTADGCLIYNSSASNKTVAVVSFGGAKTATNGTFTVSMPAAAAATAIVRLS